MKIAFDSLIYGIIFGIGFAIAFIPAETHYLLPSHAAVRLSLGEMYLRDSKGLYKVTQMVYEDQIGPINIKAHWNPWEIECKR